LIGRVLLIIALISFGILRRKQTQYHMPILLVLSGALGNVISCFIHGYVIDMIHFSFSFGYSYPLFNIADMCIFFGVLGMVATPSPKKMQNKSV
jgi:signal peptidase II